MIIWITGDRGKGKTTLAKELAFKMNAILLDGDDMRSSISKDLGYSNEERVENNFRIARLASVLQEQDFDVIVATICPDIKTEENTLWQEIYWICKCKFIHL